MSDEQILFLYKAFKCQGENGFAGDAFALTSASGILLKPDPAWPERGPGGAQRGPLGWGRARRGISVQASAEGICSKRRELAAPGSCLLRSPPQAGRSLAEPTQASRAGPLWGGFDTTVELGQRRSRARCRMATGQLPTPRPCRSLASLPAFAAGEPGADGHLAGRLPLFTVCSKPQKCLPLFCCC